MTYFSLQMLIDPKKKTVMTNNISAKEQGVVYQLYSTVNEANHQNWIHLIKKEIIYRYN